MSSKIDLAWKCFLEDSRNVAGVLNLALNPGGTACFTPERIKPECPYEVLASDDTGDGKSRPVEIARLLLHCRLGGGRELHLRHHGHRELV